MALHLVTGYKGSAHVTSADQGAFHAGLIGSGDYVFKSGRQFDAQIMTNNSIRIYDGDLLIGGRHVNLKVGTYEDVSIENGTQDMNRNDLIVCRYAKDTSTGQEAAVFAVIKGTNADETATDPAVTTGDILNEENIHEMPLYRVKIEGLTITAVEPVFELISSISELIDNIPKTADKIGAISRTGLLTATLSTGSWSSSAPYTQTVNVSGITANDVPIISCGNPSTLNADNYKALMKSYAMIDRAVTGSGNITFYCYGKKPTVNIPLCIKI